ncbi:MAG: trypsin-like peptidase domain-containing protein [Kiritimatiellae bacterium]|nr:trypsin-like peptidase domain-containing protein [Kiritimatiellia bacterium]
MRIGIFRDLPAPVVFCGGPAAYGGWRRTAGGGRFWTLSLTSPEAKAIRLRLDTVFLPPGAYLLVYDAKDPTERRGPYTDALFRTDAPFWTDSIFTADLMLECNLPPGAPDTEATLKADRIVHLYADPTAPWRRAADATHNDIVFYPAWTNTGNAVAGLGTVGYDGYLWGTGVLVSDTDDSTLIDYFLTANHCVRDQAEADTVEFYWFYQTPYPGAEPPAPEDVPRTGGGADYLAGAGTSENDFALLRLRSVPPAGAVYAGWTTEPPTNGQAVIGIHHPAGTRKRINFGAQSGGSCPSYPSAYYWEVTWGSGFTEVGSSGSPLLTESHELVGQLSGGFSSSTEPGLPDYYGRFDIAYPLVREWLDPDSDGDEMLDTWEIRYFGDPSNATAGADGDGDGFCNLAEYIADTNPTNGESFLRILSISNKTANVISFGSSTGRCYDVEFSTNLADTAWDTVQSNVPGQEAFTSVTRTNTEPAGYYRIRVHLP